MQWIIIIGARDGGSGGLAYNVHIYKRRGRISKRSSTSNSSGISFIYGSSFEENVHVFLSFVIRFEWHWLYEREKVDPCMFCNWIMTMSSSSSFVFFSHCLFPSIHLLNESDEQTNKQTNNKMKERTKAFCSFQTILYHKWRVIILPTVRPSIIFNCSMPIVWQRGFFIPTSISTSNGTKSRNRVEKNRIKHLVTR